MSAYQETINDAKSENTDKTLVQSRAIKLAATVVTFFKFHLQECETQDGIDVDYDQQQNRNPKQ